MNAIQIVGAVFTALGVVFLAIVGFGRLRAPAGHNVGLARQDAALLPAGAGLFLIGLVLMIR